MSDTHFIVVGGKSSTHTLARRIVEDCLPHGAGVLASYGLATDDGYEFRIGGKSIERYPDTRTGFTNHVAQFMAEAGLATDTDRLNLFFLDNPYGENDFDQTSYRAMLQVRDDPAGGFLNLVVWHVVLGYDTGKPADVTRQTDDQALGIAIRASEGSPNCYTLFLGPRNINGGAVFEGGPHHDFALPRALADFMLLVTNPNTLDLVGNAVSPVFTLGHAECMYHADDVRRLMSLYMDRALVRLRLDGPRSIVLKALTALCDEAQKLFRQIADKYKDEWLGKNPADFLLFLEGEIGNKGAELNVEQKRRATAQSRLNDLCFLRFFKKKSLEKQIGGIAQKIEGLESAIGSLKQHLKQAKSCVEALLSREADLAKVSDYVRGLEEEESRLTKEIDLFRPTTHRDTWNMVDLEKIKAHFESEFDEKNPLYASLCSLYEKSGRGDDALTSIFEDQKKRLADSYARVDWTSPFCFIMAPDNIGALYADLAKQALPRVCVSKEKASLFSKRQIFVFANGAAYAKDDVSELPRGAYQSRQTDALRDKICMIQLTAVNPDSLALLTGEAETPVDSDNVEELDTDSFKALPVNDGASPDIIDVEDVEVVDATADDEDEQPESPDSEQEA